MVSKQLQALRAATPKLNEQEFRNIIYEGIEYDFYKVSSDGLVKSYKHDKKEGRILKWIQSGKTKNMYPAVTLCLPIEKLKNVNRNRSAGVYKFTIARNIKIHILVADAWINIETNCPIELKPFWGDKPLEEKKILRCFFHINHIDSNTLNPEVSNLEFISPKNNIWHGIKQGSFN